MYLNLDDTHRIKVEISGTLITYTPEFKVNAENTKWFIHGDTFIYPFPVEIVFTTHILFDCCLRNPKFMSDVLFNCLDIPAVLEE